MVEDFNTQSVRADVHCFSEIDNTTVSVYRNFAFSEFKSLKRLGTLSTAGTIAFALVKPPLAKLTNVIGRGQTYTLAISFYLISYMVMSTAKGFNQYAAGSIFHSMGQSGANLLNDIIVADITTIRWRSLAIGLLFWPFLVIPWVAAFITSSVNSTNGIGWRWGIGMLGFLMPACASLIIVTLLYYQNKAKKQGLAPRSRITLYEFCSQIDLGGLVLFTAGLGMLTLPMTLADTATGQWKTPWIIALIIVGGILLIVLPFYEHYIARFPVIPPHYFTNRTIVVCLFLTTLDNIGFSATHTYLFSWAKVAKGLSTRDATFFIYTNGVVQCLASILAGVLVGKTRRYKWVAVVGTGIRLIGYGVMCKLRGSENSVAELFAVQAIQGLGSGLLGAVHLIPSQAVVPHAQMPQMTALNICMSFVGSSLGACIAGGIYTNTIEPALWHHLGEENTTAAVVASLADSITGVLPAWGTPERVAISSAVRLRFFCAFPPLFY
jgi:MFS family permease